jgi:hypothetical protein
VSPPSRLRIGTNPTSSGNRLAVSIEEVPEDPVIPNLSYAGPISLKAIDVSATLDATSPKLRHH